MALRERFKKERASHERVTNHPALALLAHPSLETGNGEKERPSGGHLFEQTAPPSLTLGHPA
jgi:hypothetical protein